MAGALAQMPTPSAALTFDELYADPVVGYAELSPSGRYLAMSGRQGEKEYLAVRDLQSNTVKVLEAYGDETGAWIDWIKWKSDDRLLYALTIYTEKRRGGTEDGRLLSFQYGRAVFAIDRDGANSVMVFSQDKGVQRRSVDLATMLHPLRADPQHVLMLAPAANFGLSVYKVNTSTGASELIEKGSYYTVAWNADRTGAIVGRIDVSSTGRALILKARDGKGGWDEVRCIRAKDLRDTADFEVLGPTETSGKMFVLTEPKDASEGDTNAIRTYDLNTRQMGDVVYRHARYDVSNAIIDEEEGKLLAACFTIEVFQCEFFDKTLQANFKALNKYFKGERSVFVLSVSHDERYWLLDVRGGNERGGLHVFDYEKKSVDEVDKRWPALNPARLGSMSAFAYKARDGVDLNGYVTMPPGAAASPPPLIVMPHGGPEMRDTLSFDQWGQYFATRGYAVFQPNFRGSSGFGRAFAESGYRQWGARMQDDVTDGANALIAAGRVDPKRVCIVGASYGGYAALYGGAKQADLYKCVVSVAGISDLSEFVKWQKRAGGSDSSRFEYWTKSIGDTRTDAAMLTDKSPLTYAASYKPPVLLFHGQADDIVPYEQTTMMEKVLKKSGANVKMLLYETEGHSNWSHVNEKAMLSEIETFLATHLK